MLQAAIFCNPMSSAVMHRHDKTTTNKTSPGSFTRGTNLTPHLPSREIPMAASDHRLGDHKLTVPAKLRSRTGFRPPSMAEINTCCGHLWQVFTSNTYSIWNYPPPASGKICHIIHKGQYIKAFIFIPPGRRLWLGKKSRRRLEVYYTYPEADVLRFCAIGQK